MKTKAVSRLFALDLAPLLKKPHIIISILEPGAEPLVFAPNKNRLAVLTLNFYDLDYDPKKWGEKDTNEIVKEYGHGLFKVAQAEAILDFVEQWHDLAAFALIHCEAGVSRSAAVSAAIDKIYTGSDMAVFGDPKYIPNRYVYRTILEARHWRR
jgi:predicted protein tyrosine phosphatase